MAITVKLVEWVCDFQEMMSFVFAFLFLNWCFIFGDTVKFCVEAHTVNPVISDHGILRAKNHTAHFAIGKFTELTVEPHNYGQSGDWQRLPLIQGAFISEVHASRPTF